jgi:hypothetical protein
VLWIRRARTANHVPLSAHCAQLVHCIIQYEKWKGFSQVSHALFSATFSVLFSVPKMKNPRQKASLPSAGGAVSQY